MKTKLSYRIISVLLVLSVFIGMLPATGLVAFAASNSTSITDNSTIDDWQDWFTADSNRFSGGVFMDKSVYTSSQALADSYFTDIKNNISFGKDNFGNENFMVALSALGSNTEIFGYSHTPTDTMIVLDASTSMGTGDAASSAIDDMVAGANEAIKRLLALNNYNRVGVVIYNGRADVLLPLDHYTSTTGGDILEFRRESVNWQTRQNRIYVANNVVDGDDQPVASTYIAQAQGTYTQGGFYYATQEFLAADTVIDDGKIQGGTKRLPIMVLMSDGEPSYRTTNYTQATNDNCDRSAFREDDSTAFHTMLTAAWAEAAISDHYDQDARFYTLGYNLSANHQYAQNVLDPMNPNNALASRFSSFASSYLAMAKDATRQFTGSISFNVTRKSDPALVTTLDYVDRYWHAANASNLTAAFDSIVDEIVIQSRYYSTLVSGTDAHQDGYISFTDEIGTHMEVKNIKGFYIGDGKLVSGGMFAEFAETGDVTHVGPNYTDDALEGFENEILAAICERFNISASEASTLINSAKEDDFIYWNSATKEFSNYIAWYADENINYLAPYSAKTSVHSDDAKYIVRSYFYMGDVTQNHVETSMLYALVRVREEIATGRQIVDMDIPAALLPMITYTVTVDGDTFTDSALTGMTAQLKKPISLLFEVGLNDELTPYNISETLKNENYLKNADGTYSFYTNRWHSDTGSIFTIPSEPNVSVFNHGKMNTTVTQFIPSQENERYYYTKDTQVLEKVGTDYRAYTGSKPSGDGYYHKYEWVQSDGNGGFEIATEYNPITANAMNGHVTASAGGWVIPKGTPKSFFVKGTVTKDPNTTGTLGWVNAPDVVYHQSTGHTGYHMLDYLGNNGKLTAAPAQGIRLTKSISQVVENAPTSFTFNVKLSGAAIEPSYPVYIERANGTTETLTLNVTADTLSVEISTGDVAYITGIASGTAYEVTEAYTASYVGSSTNASGVVSAYTLNDVSFVNSPKGYGSLLVSKDVEHNFALHSVPAALETVDFDITVTFEGDANDIKQIVDHNGAVNTAGNTVFNVTLRDGTGALFTHIPEGVKYTVVETLSKAGFTFNAAKSTDLTGTIQNDSQSHASVINTYAPDAVSPNITLKGTKEVEGLSGTADTYDIALVQVEFGGSSNVAVGAPITIAAVKDGEDYTYNMSAAVSYDEIGTYSYEIYEIEPSAPVTNVAYDKSIGIFSVTVTDNDVDGALEISKVETHLDTASLSGDAATGWQITKNFNNVYMADQIEFNVEKHINGLTDHAHDSGILFGLFADKNDDVPKFYAITDDDGIANFAVNVLQADYLTPVTYYLRELNPPIDLSVTGMTYDTSWKYQVTIEWSSSMHSPLSSLQQTRALPFRRQILL